MYRETRFAILTLIFSLGLCACQSGRQPTATVVVNQPARSSPEAQKAAVDKEIHCLVQKVAELDDGISPANVIGHYLGQACRSEIIGSRVALYQGLTFITPAYAWQHQDKIANDAGTSTVLSYRHQKIVNQQTSPKPSGG
jgi:hypothetical protein